MTNFTLTAGADSIPGPDDDNSGNDLISGDSSDFSINDTIDGGLELEVDEFGWPGVDILKINFVLGAESVSALSFANTSGIEVIELSNDSGLGTVSIVLPEGDIDIELVDGFWLTADAVIDGSQVTSDLAIWGGDGNNTIIGGAGDDFLGGGAGFNELTGGEGNNELEGGQSGDLLIVNNTEATFTTLRGDFIDEVHIPLPLDADTFRFDTAVGTYVVEDFKIGILGLIDIVDLSSLVNSTSDFALRTSSENGYSVSVLIGGDDKSIMQDSFDAEIIFNTSGWDFTSHWDFTAETFGLSQGNGFKILGSNFQRDLLLGTRGNDTMNGGYGHDTLHGSWGDDILSGSLGDDELFGGDGADWLTGGKGDDTLVGSATSFNPDFDQDTFLFRGFNNEGNDVIRNFDSGEDKIRIITKSRDYDSFDELETSIRTDVNGTEYFVIDSYGPNSGTISLWEGGFGAGVEITADDFDFVYRGGGGGGSVICTELHRQGYMSDKIFEADQKFGRLVAQNDPEVLIGYHFWANPIVKLMQISPTVTHLVCLFAMPWAHEMAFRMGVKKKGNLFGKFLMATAIPACRMIGRIKARKVKSKDWIASP